MTHDLDKAALDRHLTTDPRDVPDIPSTFEVDKIVDNEQINDVHWATHKVQVTLGDVTYRHLLTDLSRAVFKARVAKRPVFAWLIRTGSNEVRGIEHQDSVTRLRSILSMENPSWNLTPEEATALGNALLEAAEEPVECECGRAIESPSQLTVSTGCATCATRRGIV